MKACIAFLAYNRLAYTRECLSALIRNTPADLCRLLLIDNGSTDGTAEYLTDVAARLSNAETILLPENRGLAGGWNEGLRRCDPDELFIRMTNDTRIERDYWLESLLAWSERLPDAGQIAHWFFDNRNDQPYRLERKYCLGRGKDHVVSRFLVAGLVASTPEAIQRVGAFWSPLEALWWPVALDYSERIRLAGLHSYYVHTGRTTFVSGAVKDGKTKKGQFVTASETFCTHVHRRHDHNVMPVHRQAIRQCWGTIAAYSTGARPVYVPLVEGCHASV